MDIEKHSQTEPLLSSFPSSKGELSHESKPTKLPHYIIFLVILATLLATVTVFSDEGVSLSLMLNEFQVVLANLIPFLHMTEFL